MILFKVHVGEEYLTEKWSAFSDLGQPMTERTFFLVAATIAPIFWLLGLILLYLRTEIGNWMTRVFVVAMAVVETSHLLFPFMDTGAGWYLAFRLYRA